MQLHNREKIPLLQKYRLVQRYIKSGQSLRKLSSTSGIPYKTIWSWVQRYKKEGRDGLVNKKVFRKKLPKQIIKKIMLLKEKHPSLSIRQAKLMLDREGIRVSNKGIWSVWKRYGLSKRNPDDPLNPCVALTDELREEITRTKAVYRKGDPKTAAKMLNNLPCMPEDNILVMLPEKYLSPRRRLERLHVDLGKYPLMRLARRAGKIGHALEKQGYVYSSIIADFIQLNLLSWMQRSQEKIPVLNNLEKKMTGLKDRALWFFFFFERAYTYCDLLNVKEALTLIRECQRFVYSFPYPKYLDFLGGFFTNLGDYKNVLKYYKKSYMRETKQNMRTQYAVKLVYAYCMTGHYAEGRKLLAKTAQVMAGTGVGTLQNLTNAYISFGTGDLAGCHDHFLKALQNARKSELLNLIASSSTGLATISNALNNLSETKGHLNTYLPLMAKYKLKRESTIMRCLLNVKQEIPVQMLQQPPFYLLYLLVQTKRIRTIGHYRKVYSYSVKKGLQGLFHRWIVFFPEPVLHLLEKGKSTGLPRAILQFPIFNQKIPVYHIKFLGDVVVYKNQQYLKTKLSPKEMALLIHLALKAGAPGKFILLSELYHNFWPKKENPSNLLSHLLVNIRRKLMIPTHLIEIAVRPLESVLMNRGLYFVTDYSDFEITLARAKALEHIDEWGFAKKEYLRAFKLFRGKPFKKMYDNWSEQMRMVILNKLENKALHFANSCLEHHNKTDAKKVLQKALKIISYSAEIKKLLESVLFQHMWKKLAKI